MMIRRFNFTQRKRINREHVSISLNAITNEEIVFDADINLRSYGLPDDAKVFIEAYRRTTVMRFPAGTVGNIVIPELRRLSEFDQPDGILFRVKVSSLLPDQGKLVAEADRIPFRRLDEQQNDRSPLLPVQVADIGSLLTKVDFEGDPTLLISQEFGDWRELAKDNVFRSLVLPNAFREILAKIFLIDQDWDLDESVGWQSQWIQYVKQLPGIDSFPDNNDSTSAIETWIDGVVRIFCERTNMLDRFKSYWQREDYDDEA